MYLSGHIMIQRYISNRRVRILIGLLLAGGLLVQGHRALLARSATEPIAAASLSPHKPGPHQAFAAPTPDLSLLEAETLEALAARDPIAFFEVMLDRYDRAVRDYTCTFSKKELVGGRMTRTQVMEAMCRQSPFSVLLKWVKNPDKCSRVLYVDDRWVKNNQEMAVVEPGAIARLFVPYVMRPIHGKDAKKSSRRTIDQFGFRNSLALTLKYCKLAQEQNILDFAFLGAGQVGGRETLVFERRLPYTGEDCVWPDRVLVVHIDKELLLPTLCVAYADDGKETLLGEYKMTDIKLNPNLPDSTFTKKGMGL